MPFNSIFLFMLAFSLLTVEVSGEDWPQVLGPQRDGTAEEPLGDWQAKSPKIIWQREIGSGYAGPAVAGTRLVLAHRQRQEELLECFDTQTGKTLWKAEFPATYQPAVDPDDGPRCVPLIANDKVFSFGAAGDLRCVALQSGKEIWQRPLRAEVDAPDGYFGAGSSPLMVDDVLILCAGGKEGAVVGLSPKDGKILWKTGKMEAAYASPVPITVNGQSCVLCVLRLEAVLLRVQDGSVIASVPFGARGPTVNAATPLINGTQCFLTASYGVGAKLIDWQKSPQTLWENDQSLSSQYVTPLRNGKQIVGIHGRDDIGVAELRCCDWSTGRVLWSEEGFGTAHLMNAKNDFLALGRDGRFIRFAKDLEQYTQKQELNLPAGTYRALPALSGGKFFCRSNEPNQLLAIEVGP